MPRYIDADYLDELITQLIKEGRNITRNDYKMIDSILFEFPTADVVERKKGKWEVCDILDYAQRPTGRKVGKCSHCGHLTDDFLTIVESSKNLTNFCPNCGADMREESDNG